MSIFSGLRDLTGPQRRAFTAAYLGWTLDAFDFFLLVMVEARLADAFHTSIKAITYAIWLTLAMRPVGAVVFGLLSEKYGRRPALMASILFFAVFELLSGLAPTLTTFYILRAVFGIGMGGEWGVGASLAMESVPAKSRGLLSGILQQGYPAGYLLAAVAYRVIFPVFGWRGMFIIGSLPALLVIYIRSKVEESPDWIARRGKSSARTPISEILEALRTRWPLFLFMVVLMAAFNCFSHGTQDLYPSAYLEKQRGLDIGTVTKIVVIYNLGSISGGFLTGAVSQWIGRRRAIAAAALLALPMIPLWVHSTSVAGLAAGAFLIQFCVQGAWGVVPAHLNELSPGAVRGIFPGFAYQLGNFCTSFIPTLQASLAASHGGDYAYSLGWVVGVAALVLTAIALLGSEARTAELAPSAG